METIRDDITSASKLLDNEDIVSYILNGLGFYYDHVIVQLTPISFIEMYAKLKASIS